MKPLKLDDIREDAVASAAYGFGSETITATGFVCRIDKDSISLSSSRDASVVVEYPKDGILAAFHDDVTGLTTLIVKSGVKTRTISTSTVATQPGQRLFKGRGCRGSQGTQGQLQRRRLPQDICDGYLALAQDSIALGDDEMFDLALRAYINRC